MTLTDLEREAISVVLATAGGGMMGGWAPMGMSLGLSVLVTRFPAGRCGYAIPVIALAGGWSRLPYGARSSIVT